MQPLDNRKMTYTNLLCLYIMLLVKNIVHFNKLLNCCNYFSIFKTLEYYKILIKC